MPWPFFNTCMVFHNRQMCPKTLVFILTNYFSLGWGIKSWLELSRIGPKLAFLNCPMSIASYQEEENSRWTRTGMGPASFASRRSRGILFNHQPLIRSLKNGFHGSSTITLHPYCNYWLGTVFCFPILWCCSSGDYP